MSSKIKATNSQGKTLTIENIDSVLDDVSITSKDLAGIKSVDTLADLRTMKIPVEKIWVSGYHTKNDGAFGSHIFRLKGVKTTETDNGGTVIIATIGGVDYVYELQFSGAVNVKWFGANVVVDSTVILHSVSTTYNNIIIDSQIIINGDCDISNSNITLTGSISGTGKLYGTNLGINGKNSGYINNVYLEFNGGDLSIAGVKFTGKLATAAILLTTLTTISDKSTICNNEFNSVNYGILRQGGFGLQMNNCCINDNLFKDNRGDAVEWNVATSDSNILVFNNIINNIDGTNQFWGIGIGFAGASYTTNYLTTSSVKNFKIYNNVITGVKQGIHIENGQQFEIYGNTVTVDSSKSELSGLAATGIQIYGSLNYSVYDNKVSILISGKGISFDWGTKDGAYIAACNDYELYNNKVFNGDIETYSAGISAANRTAKIYRNNIHNGNMSYYGSVSKLQIEENDILEGSLNVNCRTSFGNGRDNTFVSDSVSISIINNKHTIKSAGAGSFINLVGDIVTVMNNSISASKSTASTSNITTRVGANVCVFSTRIVGYPLIKGDLMYKSDGTEKYLITSSGSLVLNADICTAVAGETRLKTANYNWVGYHTAGEKINISGIGVSGGTLTTTVTRSSYVSGGFYYIGIADPVVTTGSGTITPETVATYVSI